jgi:hypothetical protein
LEFPRREYLAEAGISGTFDQSHRDRIAATCEDRVLCGQKSPFCAYSGSTRIKADGEAASGHHSDAFDWLVVGQVVPVNPAASVRGPRYSVSKGLTPIVSAEEARGLFSGMDLTSATGLRDRAITFHRKFSTNIRSSTEESTRE